MSQYGYVTNTNRHRQTPQDTDRCCLSMSGRVPWYLLSPVGMSCSLKMSGDVWGVFGGYLSSIHGNLSPSDVIGGYRDSQSLQYGAKALLRHSPERHNFCHLTLLRHWNIKMVAYKLSKNGWVMLFFVIFRLAREKLLVTVALDHPVPIPHPIPSTQCPTGTRTRPATRYFFRYPTRPDSVLKIIG